MIQKLVTDPVDGRLLDEWQRDLPLVPRPFAEIARVLGLDEAAVIDRLHEMRATGRITRVGATCAPNTVSASTLAAIAVPPETVEEVAAVVGAEPGVNHSYLREHRYNLWFVTTGPDRDHVTAALERIGAATGLEVLDLPLVQPFNVDLGFALNREDGAPPPSPRKARPEALEPGDRQLLQALSARGLPLCPAPYAQLGEALDRSERAVIDRIAALVEAGIISRLGVIVRHRALGWRANAMVVWDIGEASVEAAGWRLAAHPGVTLCYERRPIADVWPYRLYCMIHAKTRPQALQILTDAAELPELAGVPHRALFSLRCYKQTGAMIADNARLT